MVKIHFDVERLAGIYAGRARNDELFRFYHCLGRNCIQPHTGQRHVAGEPEVLHAYVRRAMVHRVCLINPGRREVIGAIIRPHIIKFDAPKAGINAGIRGVKLIGLGLIFYAGLEGGPHMHEDGR